MGTTGEERRGQAKGWLSNGTPPAPFEQPSPESPRPLVINPFSQNVVRLLCRNASAVSGRWKCDLTLQTRTSSQLRFYQVNLNSLNNLFFEHRCQPIIHISTRAIGFFRLNTFIMQNRITRRQMAISRRRSRQSKKSIRTREYILRPAGICVQKIDFLDCLELPRTIAILCVCVLGHEFLQLYNIKRPFNFQGATNLSQHAPLAAQFNAERGAQNSHFTT